MVDVKRVTASVKKPALYTNAITSITDEVININPLDTVPNVYTIDPFSIFIQESGALKVKIPYSRFYRIKYAVSLTDANDPSNDPDQFTISKPVLTCSESITIKRLSNGVVTDIKENVYNQDGSGFIVYDPPYPYTIRKVLNPGIVEGIVELYAGDVLTFQHTRTMFKKSSISNTLNGLFIVEPGGPLPPPGDSYLRAGTRNYYSFPPYDYINTFYQASISLQPPTTDSTAFRASASFFFEISEITDL